MWKIRKKSGCCNFVFLFRENLKNTYQNSWFLILFFFQKMFDRKISDEPFFEIFWYFIRLNVKIVMVCISIQYQLGAHAKTSAKDIGWPYWIWKQKWKKIKTMYITVLIFRGLYHGARRQWTHPFQFSQMTYHSKKDFFKPLMCIITSLKKSNTYSEKKKLWKIGKNLVAVI